MHVTGQNTHIFYIFTYTFIHHFKGLLPINYKHDLLVLNLNFNFQKQDVCIVENITKSFYSFSLGLPKAKRRVAK